MPIIYLNVSLSQYYQTGAASKQGDKSFRYFGLFVHNMYVHLLVSGAQTTSNQGKKHTCCKPCSIDGLPSPPMSSHICEIDLEEKRKNGP